MSRLTPNLENLPAGLDPNTVLALVAKYGADPSSLTQAETEIVDSLTPAQVNPCGDCTLCCTAPSIAAEEVDGVHFKAAKPACVACEHVGGGGCKVYKTRPGLCKSYMCLYAMGAIPYAPKDTGVAWSIQQNQRGDALLMGHTMDAAKAYRNPLNLDIMLRMLQTGDYFAATVRDSVEVFTVTPDGWMDTCKVDQEDPVKQRLDLRTVRPHFARITIKEQE